MLINKCFMFIDQRIIIQRRTFYILQPLDNRHVLHALRATLLIVTLTITDFRHPLAPSVSVFIKGKRSAATNAAALPRCC